MNHAGDVSARTTYEALSDRSDTVLVDVRTQAELVYVGYPDLSSIEKPLIVVEWQHFPSGATNTTFVQELTAAGVDRDADVHFICRSGVRSGFAASAATSAGFRTCYNVADGFEGPIDQQGHRGTDRGWKASGLPWRQS